MKSLEQEYITADRLLQSIAREYDGLSERLKTVARYIGDNSDQVGLGGIRAISDGCGVPPSTVVRFAKHFGFSGFAAMQQLFRDHLFKMIATESNQRPSRGKPIGRAGFTERLPDIADEVLERAIDDMDALRRTLDGAAFTKAVDLLAEAPAIWITGSGCAFPIALYLEQMLQHTDKRVGLFSTLGGTHIGQTRSVRRGDILIAIFVKPYARETTEIVRQSLPRGARLITITDSRGGPFATDSEVVLLAPDRAIPGVEGITGTIALVESCFVALCQRRTGGASGPLESAS